MSFDPPLYVTDLWPELDHAWLNPQNVKEKLPRLAETMAQQFPDASKEIAANLRQSRVSIAEIRSALDRSLKRLQSDGIIMQHPSWRGLFESFGIPILLTLESQQHGHEHGPRHLEEALEVLKRHPNALLVGDIRHSNRSLEWLASHSESRKILYLDALGSCGDSWTTLMQNNIDRINAL